MTSPSLSATAACFILERDDPWRFNFDRWAVPFPVNQATIRARDCSYSGVDSMAPTTPSPSFECCCCCGLLSGRPLCPGGADLAYFSSGCCLPDVGAVSPFGAATTFSRGWCRLPLPKERRLCLVGRLSGAQRHCGPACADERDLASALLPMVCCILWWSRSTRCSTGGRAGPRIQAITRGDQTWSVMVGRSLAALWLTRGCENAAKSAWRELPTPPMSPRNRFHRWPRFTNTPATPSYHGRG